MEPLQGCVWIWGKVVRDESPVEGVEVTAKQVYDVQNLKVDSFEVISSPLSTSDEQGRFFLPVVIHHNVQPEEAWIALQCTGAELVQRHVTTVSRAQALQLFREFFPGEQGPGRDSMEDCVHTPNPSMSGIFIYNRDNPHSLILHVPS